MDRASDYPSGFPGTPIRPGNQVEQWPTQLPRNKSITPINWELRWCLSGWGISRRYLTGFLALAPAGCASVPLAPSEGDQRAKQFEVPADKPLLCVARGESPVFGGPPTVSIDERFWGELGKQPFLAQKVHPGKHRVRVQSSLMAAEKGITIEKGRFLVAAFDAGLFSDDELRQLEGSGERAISGTWSELNNPGGLYPLINARSCELEKRD